MKDRPSQTLQEAMPKANMVTRRGRNSWKTSKANRLVMANLPMPTDRGILMNTACLRPAVID